MIEDLKERQEARRQRNIENIANESDMSKAEATKLLKEEPAAGAKKSSQPAEWKANA